MQDFIIQGNVVELPQSETFTANGQQITKRLLVVMVPADGSEHGKPQTFAFEGFGNNSSIISQVQMNQFITVHFSMAGKIYDNPNSGKRQYFTTLKLKSIDGIQAGQNNNNNQNNGNNNNQQNNNGNQQNNNQGGYQNNNNNNQAQQPYPQNNNNNNNQQNGNYNQNNNNNQNNQQNNNQNNQQNNNQNNNNNNPPQNDYNNNDYSNNNNQQPSAPQQQQGGNPEVPKFVAPDVPQYKYEHDMEDDIPF